MAVFRGSSTTRSCRQAAVVPFRLQEMGIRVQQAIVKGRTPFATTRYMSFPLSLTHILTQYLRLISPKNLSATCPHSSLKPRIVNPHTAAMTFKSHSHLIYCVDGSHAFSSSRLFSSTNFFTNDRKLKDISIGKNAKGVIAFAIVGRPCLLHRWHRHRMKLATESNYCANERKVFDHVFGFGKASRGSFPKYHISTTLSVFASCRTLLGD